MNRPTSIGRLAASRRRRRRSPWTRRVLCASFLVPLIVSYAWSVYCQRRAVTAVWQAGGYVKYDFEIDGGSHASLSRSWLAVRLRRWLGNDLISPVAAVAML